MVIGWVGGDGSGSGMCSDIRMGEVAVVLGLGPGQLCRHFEHNRSLKELSIIGHIIYL